MLAELGTLSLTLCCPLCCPPSAAVKEALEQKGLMPQLQASMRAQIFKLLLASEVTGGCCHAVHMCVPALPPSHSRLGQVQPYCCLSLTSRFDDRSSRAQIPATRRCSSTSSSGSTSSSTACTTHCLCSFQVRTGTQPKHACARPCQSALMLCACVAHNKSNSHLLTILLVSLCCCSAESGQPPARPFDREWLVSSVGRWCCTAVAECLLPCRPHMSLISSHTAIVPHAVLQAKRLKVNDTPQSQQV